MKIVSTFLVICLALAYSEVQIIEQDPELGDPAELDALENELSGLLSGLLGGTINANDGIVLNGYIDRLFAHLRNIVAKDGYNTIPLPKESFKASHAAHIDVHAGSLSDLCTIYRTDNVIVSLDTAAKKVTLQFPFKFDDLKVHYDFHVKALKFFKTHGGIDGHLKEVRFHPILSFNYNTDTFTIEHFDMKHTGQITVKFTGHKLVDWLINALTKAVTSIMHPHIVNEIQHKVGSAFQKLIERLDVDIHKKLHPTF